MDEYIKRDKALAETWKEPRYTDVMNVLTEIRDRIRSLPSEDVQPVVQWIPCSERLPDKPNVYTVTDHNGKVVRYVFYDNESSREYWRRCAKAWMPLPEPYQEGADNG